jgi:uncharacterized metal-binding protein YceD (DUF177 family)
MQVDNPEKHRLVGILQPLVGAVTVPLVELSRTITAQEIKDSPPCELLITATDEERRAISTRFKLIEIIDLKAKLDFAYMSFKSVIKVSGIFDARVLQTCVVSLEPFAMNIKGMFKVEYSEKIDENEVQVIDFELSDEDPYEPIIDGKFDVGIILTEEFGLELDPFPRTPGIKIDEVIKQYGGKSLNKKENNPFAVLKKLK